MKIGAIVDELDRGWWWK